MKNRNGLISLMLIIGFVPILFKFNVCFSQALFEKTYQVNTGGLVAGWSLVTNDYFVWSGSNLPYENGITVTPSSIWFGALIVTNTAGDTLWTKINIDSSYKTTYGPLIDNLDGTFYVVGDKVDQNNEFYEYFVEQYTYSSSQFINRFSFPDTIPFDCQRSLKLSSGDLLLGGSYKDFLGIARAYLINLNTTGNVNWKLELPSLSNSVNQVYAIEEFGNNIQIFGYYLDSSYIDKLVHFAIDFSTGQILQIDTLPTIPVNGYNFGGVYSKNNGINSIIGGCFPNPTFYDIGLVYFDLNSNTIFLSDTLQANFTDYLRNTQKTDSDNGILSGQTSSPPSNGGQFDAFSALVDSNVVLTQNYHFGDPQYDDFFQSSHKLNNTFVSFGNSIRNTPNGLRNLAYIVRYDSLGNISTGRSELLQDQVVQVFPNPAKEYFRIVATQQYEKNTFQYTLYDQQGKLMSTDSFIHETRVSVNEYSGQQLCFLIVQGENYYQAFKIMIE